MFKMEEEEQKLSISISSELNLVERVVNSVCDFIQQFEQIEANFNVRLVLREILNNAIEHGNKNQKEKAISCSISKLEGPRFCFEVNDEGEGFDYSSISLEMTQEDGQPRNRGYALINQFSDEIVFEKRKDEAKGFLVRVFFTITRETRFISEKKGSGVIEIVPSGDITAGNAEEFRKLLLEEVEMQPKEVTFNLEKVKDIDSTGLGVFASFGKLASERLPDATLKVVNSTEDIHGLFCLTRLNKVYNLEKPGSGLKEI
ncbi:ATP-binding protein [Candidatus Riflebacteria bacterium]